MLQQIPDANEFYVSKSFLQHVFAKPANHTYVFFLWILSHHTSASLKSSGKICIQYLILLSQIPPQWKLRFCQVCVSVWSGNEAWCKIKAEYYLSFISLSHLTLIIGCECTVLIQPERDKITISLSTNSCQPLNALSFASVRCQCVSFFWQLLTFYSHCVAFHSLLCVMRHMISDTKKVPLEDLEPCQWAAPDFICFLAL